MSQREKLLEHPLIGRRIRARFEHRERLKEVGIGENWAITSDFETNFIRVIENLSSGLRREEDEEDSNYSWYTVIDSEDIDRALDNLAYLYYNILQGYDEAGSHQHLKKLWTLTDEEIQRRDEWRKMESEKDSPTTSESGGK